MTVLLVCSMGGHWAEMRLLQPAFVGRRMVLVTYQSAVAQDAGGHRLHNLGTNPFRHAMAFVRAARILRLERPRLIMSTGSEIALPFFLLARLVGIPTIYVESVTRVRSLSGTGRILRRVATRFYVQWPGLAAADPRLRYAGGLL